MRSQSPPPPPSPSSFPYLALFHPSPSPSHKSLTSNLKKSSSGSTRKTHVTHLSTKHAPTFPKRPFYPVLFFLSLFLSLFHARLNKLWISNTYSSRKEKGRARLRKPAKIKRGLLQVSGARALSTVRVVWDGKAWGGKHERGNKLFVSCRVATFWFRMDEWMRDSGFVKWHPWGDAGCGRHVIYLLKYLMLMLAVLHRNKVGGLF